MSTPHPPSAPAAGHATALHRRAHRHSSARWSRRVAVDLVGAADVLAVIAGSLVPALIYANSGGVALNWAGLLQSAIASAAIVYGCLRHWNMYDTNSLHDFPIHSSRLLMALGVSAIAMLGLGLPFAPDQIHMWVWYAAWISASFTFILAGRIIARAMMQTLTAAGRFDTRIAVFGAGSIASTVHNYLSRNALGIHLVGVYDDRIGPERQSDQSIRIDGSLDDLIEAGRRDEIDQIIIALPQTADSRMAYIAARLEQLPVSLHIVTHIASDLVETGPAHKVSSIGAVGLLDVKPRPMTDWGPIVKRIEDYGLAVLLLILTLPLLAIIALAVKLETRGPVLFRQSRRGLNHTVFEVIKFRTMTVTEDGSKLAQATRNDPRVTRVGRVLRRTSLDELPQLFNVLRGEMSLVGPRPHALAHDDQWCGELDVYTNRHQVKPGITGLAQVNGWRGEIHNANSIQSRVECDLVYIRNWSLWLDLKIIIRTVAAVLFARNAH